MSTPKAPRFFRQFLAPLAKRVLKESSEDNLLGLAAQTSFFFVLALIPFFIFVAALVGTLPFTELWNQVLSWIVLYLPRSTQHMIFRTVANLTHGHLRFLSVGILSSAWATIGGLTSLMTSLGIVYEVKETRSILLRLIIAFFMLFVLVFLFLSSFGILVGGKWVIQWLLGSSQYSALPLHLVDAGRWVVSVPLMIFGLTVIDYVLPNVRRPWRWIRPGTILAVVLWIPVTFTFNFYAQNVSPYSVTYGALGDFMIIVVWIYLTSLLVLVGAEVNCELQKMRIEAEIAEEPAASQEPTLTAGKSTYEDV